MTTLIHLTNKQVIISRLVNVGGNKTAYATVTGALSELQPLSLEKTALVDGVMGKTYRIYVDPTVDIREHDKVQEVSTGKIFKVKTGGVTRRTMGSIDYVTAIVEQVN